MRFFSFFILFPLLIWTAPVSNPSFADLIQQGFLTNDGGSSMSLRVGYEGDFVSDGKMKQIEQGSGRVDRYKQTIQSGTVTLNFLDRLDLYGVFGSCKTKTSWRFTNSSARTLSYVQIKTDPSFCWALGSRCLLYVWWNTSLGIGGRYEKTKSQVQDFQVDGINSNQQNASLDWDLWQVNLDLSYKFSFLTPYIGAKYSRAKTDLAGFTTPITDTLSMQNTFENRNRLGMYLGCSISTRHYLMINLEGRFIDEQALDASLEFRF